MNSQKRTKNHNLKNFSCRHFIGEKPCLFHSQCSSCRHFAPIRNKILIIKLASLGDVLRTTPLLQGIRDRYKHSHITWVTANEAMPLLVHNPFIDRLLSFELTSIIQLQAEKFSQVISLDKAKHACALASLVAAKVKKGFGLNRWGNIYPFNRNADYAFRLGIDDALKFRYNKRSYQDVIFEVAGLEFMQQPYILELSVEQKRLSQKINQEIRSSKLKKIIGINTGCGRKFPYKKWNEKAYLKLIKQLARNNDSAIVLLGGPDEEKKNQRLKRDCKENVFLFDLGSNIGNFAALVNCCDVVVTGDTLAMHIGIALKKKIVALFGPTSPPEVELYGRGVRLASNLDCAPCYKNNCERDGECMDKITVEEVAREVKGVLVF